MVFVETLKGLSKFNKICVISLCIRLLEALDASDASGAVREAGRAWRGV